ncbi:YgiQ family radical SAM protein [Caldicellulosiruptor naganoensis]|uniref:YgiQ family radical SAM protein n=1 Tax=Caldicellulosiruptor naganoensis TaxID=29324 RepID=A0ABY7BJ89_9FIRM|nr:YgiQ family radical SAM protein [Caldicellulosiruptor naganoensis]WAM32555.1 YgiQ family radical SAM protein [Caldicellulosiruptor naganoensis]
MAFLPICREDMKKRGWDELDFVFVCGDAYVDHPSFGHAIISRIIEDFGFRIGIIPQPDWRDSKSITVLGRPRIAFLVSSGNLDSMVAHYTSFKKPRSQDYYSPGMKMGLRPNRATIVYCNLIRKEYGDIPIIIGGIEASLRRFAHYDYWSDKVRASILIDSSADLLIYGMGEKPLFEILSRLKKGEDIKSIKDVKGTCYVAKDLSHLEGRDYIIIDSYEKVKEDKVAYAKAFAIQYREQNPFTGRIIVQPHRNLYVIQNPPAEPLTTEEMDYVYSLPYERNYHPIYEKDGGIKALEEVKFSIVSHRGCFGGCNFCALHFHQGRIIQKRSEKSILEEVKKLTQLPDFKGYIHDVGGPTANFRNPACFNQLQRGACKDRGCLFPTPCKNLIVDHREYFELLEKIRKIKGVKKVFIRSGIRYDYLLLDKDYKKYLEELCRYYVSGQLKIAPEHICNNVLKYMGKPQREVYEKFVEEYFKTNKKLGKKQFIIPYLMSGHPGCTLNDAIELALYLKKNGFIPEQVQDFYPTPGTVSTTMYYTGLNPFTLEKVYVPKTLKEKMMQRALLHFHNPKNYDLVYEALKLANREDLIGYEKNCLIPPKKHGGGMKSDGKYNRRQKNSANDKRRG